MLAGGAEKSPAAPPDRCLMEGNRDSLVKRFATADGSAYDSVGL